MTVALEGRKRLTTFAQGPPPRQPGEPDDPRPEQPHPAEEPGGEPPPQPGETGEDEELGS
jgi:hypothetical protein